MAITLTCSAKETYIADGIEVNFDYYFETIKDSDLYVAVWDNTTKEYNNVTNWSKDPVLSIITFDEPPAQNTQIVIYRMTDIDRLNAIFSPGHPVKAQDLNNNFEQLQKAIQDTQCFSGGSGSGGSFNFDNIITTQEQKTNQWVSDDEHLAYTGALAERFDVIFLGDGQSTPQPIPGEIIQPGKVLITSDNNAYAWNGSTWFQLVTGALNYTNISTTNPITNTYTAGSNTYDIGFNIDSLSMIPSK